MMRANHPIQEHALKNAVDAQITHTQRFTEFEACVAAGLDLEKWVYWQYDVDFMADVVAWYILHNLKQVHTEDAVNRKMEKEQKKASKRRR